MTPQQAHIHCLETMPKDRIRTHERREQKDCRGYVTPLSAGLLHRYLRLKALGRKFMEIRTELNISSATMKKLRAQAWDTQHG